MIQFQKGYTTPEQSKRLLELGVPADSADCYYIDSMTSFQDKSPHIISPDYKYSDGIPNGYESRFCPCWSVGRLIEIFELCTSSKFERIKTKCSVLTDALWQIEMYVTETSKGFCIDFSKLKK